ncbi:hypothetical protein PV328_010136 [Microctonus aethiopoides]|uniref:Beta-hexosaminidase n=1 Tax=Microctonus aethiopoides TaxID=144406 RepID=A0AA39EXF2_9HYME|nr:hypothetical protein PV328_010136 [Microctonus aethiopoides]
MYFHHEILSQCFFIFFFCMRYSSGNSFHADAGPWIIPTQGEPWPMPANRTQHDSFMFVRPASFEIEVNDSCKILRDAKYRYKSIILTEARISHKTMEGSHRQIYNRNDPLYNGMLNILRVHIDPNGCELFPYLHMNESYELTILNGEANLDASTVWGALRGLETFSQLLIPSGLNLVVKNQKIIDNPKLSHRGLLLDTSRHFIPVKDILLTLDAMSYNKLNVFHWHIIDDNSFPYESKVFPELSAKGAWHPSMVYTSNDIKEVIEYATNRGIRVMPEFDTPGHVASWGLSHPELLTTCFDSTGKPDGRLGPINPANHNIWPFLWSFLSEAMTLFPDKCIHLGGDEVPFDCWESNPEIIHYMEENGMAKNFTRLESAYITELLKIPASKNVSSIVWQEVFDNGVELTPETVVHVWTGDWSEKLSRITKAGHPALLSACWYLDHIAGGGDWKKFYLCDPLDFNGSDDVTHLMIGGEACMWSEFVDRNNLHSRIWPRASAAAERLWSYKSNLHDAAQRLEEHACRMNRRSIPAQPPNGPDFCVI